MKTPPAPTVGEDSGKVFSGGSKEQTLVSLPGPPFLSVPAPPASQ